MDSLPEEISHIKPFLVRSEEMKSADPVISYYTLRYAVSLAMEYRKQNPTNQVVTEYLSNMLNLMEVKKSEINNVQNTKEHYEKFITMLFVSADTEDRKSGSTKKTAQKFLILSYFIEAFNVIEELPQNWEEKRIYCKWKTADILKSIKKGEKPLPGGPNERDGSEETKQSFNSDSKNEYSYNPPQDSRFTVANTGNPQNLYQPSPNTFQPAPSINQPPPSSFQPGPSTFQPGPNLSQPPPNIYQPPPNTYQPPPSVYQPPPVSQNPPQIQPKPEIRQSENSRTSNRPAKSTLTTEQRKIIDQAKKFGTNGIQELEYKNIQQAITNFQNAIKLLETLNS